MNITISVPEGSSSHGDPHLLCTPPQWYEYILFFLTNYLAHATTIVSIPGQSTTETICLAIAALLVPSSGIMRAVEIFIRRPVFRRKNPLNQAAAAMALCMVVKMRRDENGENPVIDSTKYKWMKNLSLVRERAKVHGQSHLPEGYVLAYVPGSVELSCRERRTEDLEQGGEKTVAASTAEIPAENKAEDIQQNAAGNTSENKSENAPETKPEQERITENLAASFNIPKAVISLAQAMWAIITLYRARGNQIDQYGYAAFGLTVAPYAYMSIINLLATCATPEYPAIYMVRTSLMKEAEANGALIVGEVADLDLDQVNFKEDQDKDNDKDNLGLQVWLGTLLSLPPLAVVGALSRFAPGSSSSLERGFTMAWLATGSVGGLWLYFGMLGMFEGEAEKDRDLSTTEKSFVIVIAFVLCFAIPLAAPAVGGFVVVAKMLREYGICTRLS
ncbi:hypothetical protein CNMCM5623_000816 [Aspergillus felis]|uniref:Uncharacterized protein n=1 Tax=Aspergillus felis TaxID=1287682 RepID=A0A8H6UYK8_9EURO|nr:hypothetical protein CNMCM5623_000816 [Aspergillus felis]